MAKKGLVSTAETPDTVQVRDSFETPRYAVDLIIPFIPKDINFIWECASGNGRIQNPLCKAGYEVYPSDIRPLQPDTAQLNFLTSDLSTTLVDALTNYKCAIITNPPFSIKKQFIEKALSLEIPFAMLINADYSGEQIGWIQRGCEKIIPNRRINYLTPNILRRIHEGEVWNIVGKNYPFHSSIEDLRLTATDEYDRVMKDGERFHYTTIEEVPQALLHKYSSSQFHSMWLTHGFNMGQTETFVNLPIKQIKENII